MRLITILALTGSAAHLGAASLPGDRVSISGWARVHGEVMLFDTRDAMVKRDYQHCISGLPAHGLLSDLSQFDGEHVSITARIVNLKSLPDEDEVILQRKLLNGHVISDFCLKDHVLSIYSISKLR
jgi:hypothetical protein